MGCFFLLQISSTCASSSTTVTAATSTTWATETTTLCKFAFTVVSHPSWNLPKSSQLISLLKEKRKEASSFEKQSQSCIVSTSGTDESGTFKLRQKHTRALYSPHHGCKIPRIFFARNRNRLTDPSRKKRKEASFFTCVRARRTSVSPFFFIVIFLQTHLSNEKHFRANAIVLSCLLPCKFRFQLVLLDVHFIVFFFGRSYERDCRRRP